jgi:hypothetical protein
MRSLPFAIILLLQLSAYSQIDAHKLDSFSRSIDSSARAARKMQDSIIKVQDSTYRSEVSRTIPKKSRENIGVAAEQKIKERRIILIATITGILLLVALIILIQRKQKSTT